MSLLDKIQTEHLPHTHHCLTRLKLDASQYAHVYVLHATDRNQVPGQDPINSTSIPYFLSFFPHKSRENLKISVFCNVMLCHWASDPNVSTITLPSKCQELSVHPRCLQSSATPLSEITALAEFAVNCGDTYLEHLQLQL
jgi:hypothetical protein